MPPKRRNPYDFLFNVDFRKYYEILVRQKGFVLVFCFSATLSSLALTYVFSEKYIAATNIYYRPLERSLLRQKGIEAFGAPVPSAPFGVIVQSLQDIIRSDAILRQVVETHGLDKTVEVEGDHFRRWMPVLSRRAGQPHFMKVLQHFIATHSESYNTEITRIDPDTLEPAEFCEWEYIQDADRSYMKTACGHRWREPYNKCCTYCGKPIKEK